MPKRCRILLILAVTILVAGLTIVVWPWDSEPQYGGKRLSVWLGSEYLGSSSISDKNKAEAIEAIRQIGTNAIPTLLEWLSYETPARTKKLLVTLDRGLLKVLQQALLESDQQKQIRGGRAVAVFQVLGPVGRSALPELNRYITNGAGINAAARARDCMRFIGPDALPFLLAAATNSQTPSRERLLWPIAYAAKQNGEVTAAVPALAAWVKDQDTRVAEEAASALGYIGVEPALAVPALMKAAQDKRMNVRSRAVAALANFGSHARPAIPVVIRCLQDESFGVETDAIRTLGTLRIEPNLVVPALTKCLHAPYGQQQAIAIQALGRFGKAAQEAVPLILPLLEDANLGVRRSATNALEQIAPETLKRT